MLLTPETMRLLLAISLVGMALLAILYLRRRSLSPAEYLAWGLLIVLLPFLGPFLVVLLRPGIPHQAPQPGKNKPHSNPIP
jgi:hypothetical protein